jgi:DNA-binding IclR family transcriptional regulator
MSDRYICAPQQRILKLIQVLAGNEISGLAPSEIAALQHCSPSITTRDLANLKAAGMAEQLPDTGRWRLAPPIVQIAVQHSIALDRAQQRLNEVRGRFSRTSSI